MQKKFDYDVKISKSLSYILRHGAVKEGLEISSDGYVKLSDILSKPKFSHCTEKKIQQIVETNDKKRFELTTKNGAVYIRATQGHSLTQVQNTELLVPLTSFDEFPVVVHGTYNTKWKYIKAEGLKKMNRNHIHLATGISTDSKVVSGMRSNCNILIFIDMELAMKDGIQFFKSTNDVVLTEGINGILPTKYFKSVETKNNKVIFTNTGGEVMQIEQKQLQEEETKINKQFQPIDYLLVLDFEAQCEENTQLNVQEIIEFPVVPINMASKQIIKDKIFHFYIKPVIYPKLTKFCTDLTGIQQEQVDNGITLIEALSKLDEYLNINGFMQSKFAFVTCGNWDLKICLPNECQAKSIAIKEYLQSWISIKDVFWKFRKTQPQPPKKKGRFDMKEMLDYLGLQLDGRHHSGIDDSLNIAKIALKLMELSGNIDFSFLQPQKMQEKFLL